MTSEKLLSLSTSFQANSWSGISNRIQVGQSLEMIRSGTYSNLVSRLREYLNKGDNEDGKANLEKEIHSLIFPMNRDSTNTSYDQHNLWLLDERLVFSEYIASDRKISRKKDALTEPDLLIFDIKRSFRSGDNEFSNPLTIFEFKRPKRNHYTQDDDPVLQIGR